MKKNKNKTISQFQVVQLRRCSRQIVSNNLLFTFFYFDLLSYCYGSSCSFRLTILFFHSKLILHLHAGDRDRFFLSDLFYLTQINTSLSYLHNFCVFFIEWFIYINFLDYLLLLVNLI